MLWVCTTRRVDPVSRVAISTAPETGRVDILTLPDATVCIYSTVVFCNRARMTHDAATVYIAPLCSVSELD